VAEIEKTTTTPRTVRELKLLARGPGEFPFDLAVFALFGGARGFFPFPPEIFLYEVLTAGFLFVFLFDVIRHGAKIITVDRETRHIYIIRVLVGCRVRYVSNALRVSLEPSKHYLISYSP